MVSQSSPCLTHLLPSHRKCQGQILAMPGTNVRITKAQLLTDFIHIFPYLVGAIHDRVCHSHLRQNDKQLVLLTTLTEGSFGRLQGAARREQLWPQRWLSTPVCNPEQKATAQFILSTTLGGFSQIECCFTSYFPIRSSMMENLCCFIKISSLPLPLGSFSEGCPLI